MPEIPEMRLTGTEDGEVFIQCRRKGCMVRLRDARFYLDILVPYDATPTVVDRMWMQHRLEHANREQ